MVTALQRRDGGWQERSTSEVGEMWSCEMDQEACQGTDMKCPPKGGKSGVKQHSMSVTCANIFGRRTRIRTLPGREASRRLALLLF